MIRFLRTLTPLGRWVLGGLLAAVLIGGFLLVQSWRSGAAAKAKARLSRNQTSAALASGADAVGAVGAVGASEVQIDVITRENERAIRTAPGADAPVDPALDAAARRGLCRRAAYRERSECVQQPAAE